MDLVTGGLGFIGNELVRQLQGVRPVAILDNRARVASHIKDLDAIAVHDVDITDNRSVRAVVERLRPERVFHLAAMHYIPECNAEPERTMRVNVEGTLAVLNACVRAGVQRVIVASSGAVYADADGSLSEDGAVAPVDAYGWSKAFAEELCRWVAGASQVSVIAARLFNNFGPRETNPHIIPEILLQLRKGDVLRLGNVSAIRDFIHTRDTARALVALADSGVNGFIPVNVASGSGVSVRDVVDAVGLLLGRQLRIVVDPARVRQTDKRRQVADISRLRSMTAWEPRIPLQEGLRELLAFEGFRLRRD